MIISELEVKLKTLREEHGDCEVFVNNNWGIPKLGFNAVCASVNWVGYTEEMHDIAIISEK